MIRLATREDAPAMLEMGRALAQESPKYRDMVFDEDKLMALGDRLNSALGNDMCCVYVAENDRHQVIGMMIGVLAERFFGSDLYVTDLTLYVRPEHRGGFAFARLVHAVELWAIARGVPVASFGVSTEVHPQRTVRAYEGLGYTVTGYTLSKELLDGH